MQPYDPDKHPKLLTQHLADGNSMTSFCSRYKLSTATVYAWLKKYPEFKEAKEAALALSQAWWEDLGKELAMKGNAAIYIFNMKNRFGWTDRRGIEVSGKIEHHKKEDALIEAFDDTEKPIELTHNKEDDSFDRED